MSLGEVDQLPVEFIPWKDTAGKISGETITPYPPGIPVVIKGERISPRQLERLTDLLIHHAYFQTGEAWKDRGIAVVKHM